MGNAVALVILCVMAGIATAAQPPTNALLSRGLGGALPAALISFLVGSAALALAVLALVPKLNLAGARSLPIYAWAGGLYGAFFVLVSAIAAPRIGAAALLTALIAGQLAMAVALDHFGLLGLATRALTTPRVIGVLLVFGGVLLIQRG